MKSIANLKQDMEFSKGLGDIIEVLKSAAILQLRAFQLKERPNEDFVKELKGCLDILLSEGIKHTYFIERNKLPSIIMIVTSDEGFLGELNTLLVNAGLDQRKSDADQIVILGERGERYLEDMGVAFKSFPGFTDEINTEVFDSIRSHLFEGYLNKFGRIFIVYPRFYSLTQQKIEVFPLLPYQRPASLEGNKKAAIWEEEMLIEPSAKKIIRVVVELLSAYKMLEIFWTSKQSEYAARIMHLEGSTHELSVLNQRITREFFRQVHTLRDRSIREISASKIMLGRK